MKATNKNKDLNIIYLNGFCQDVFHKQNNHFLIADHMFFHEVPCDTLQLLTGKCSAMNVSNVLLISILFLHDLNDILVFHDVCQSYSLGTVLCACSPDKCVFELAS